MNRHRFWELIEAARSEEAPLSDALTALPLAEVMAFEHHYESIFNLAGTADLWGAAYLIEGGCSDDCFIDFRYWLIAQGRKVYEAAVRNPDSLADVLDGEPPDEAGLYNFASDIWTERTGRTRDEFMEEVRRLGPIPREPLGKDWDYDDDDEVRRRFPRLSQVYLDGDTPDGK
jgi:hypothetical protein